MNAIVIEAPNEVYSLDNFNNLKLFIAGGISDCPDWQSTVVEKLSDVKNLTIFNPRRGNWDINDPTATEKQTIWEFNKLNEADIISFWFSKGSLNPITLYEFGYWIGKKPIIVGMDPEYQRAEHVIVQAKLAGYTGAFARDIDTFTDNIINNLYLHPGVFIPLKQK